MGAATVPWIAKGLNRFYGNQNTADINASSLQNHAQVPSCA